MNYLGTAVIVTITIHAEGPGDSCPKLLLEGEYNEQIVWIRHT